MRRPHLLIMRFSALGDVAMTVPVIRSLAMAYPDMRITVLSRPFARAFFEDLAPNVSFMEADLKTEYRGFKGLNALFRRLAAKHFTAVADFHDVLRSRWLRLRFCLGGCSVVHVNKHRKERRQLLSPSRERLSTLPSPTECYVEALSRLGFTVTPEFHSLFPPEGGNLNLLPAAVGPKNSFEQWIGVAPFAAHRGKSYPPKRMWEAVKMILDHYPHARIFLFGNGPHERNVFEQWTSESDRCLAVYKHTESLHQELILMSHLDVMVSMDSANMHLASLAAVPVVSIWGATHPCAGYMGWGQSESNAIQEDMPCRPCSIYGNRPCQRGDYACIESIPPARIYNKVVEIMSL